MMTSTSPLYLHRLGCPRGSGERAVRLVLSLDLRLPDMTGFELLEKLSQSKSGGELPGESSSRERSVTEEDARLHTYAWPVA
jgi:hypothetical protein